jgi:hypothetical protein
MPYPGTPIYERLTLEGRLPYGKWWLDARYRFGRISFSPKGISPTELEDNCYRLRNRFYSYPVILKRLFNLRSNARSVFNFAAFLRYNLLFRSQMHEKKGMRFGGL